MGETAFRSPDYSRPPHPRPPSPLGTIKLMRARQDTAAPTMRDTITIATIDTIFRSLLSVCRNMPMADVMRQTRMLLRRLLAGLSVYLYRRTLAELIEPFCVISLTRALRRIVGIAISADGRWANESTTLARKGRVDRARQDCKRVNTNRRPSQLYTVRETWIATRIAMSAR